MINIDTIEEYIENEKNYIKEDIECCGWNKELEKDLVMLNNLTKQDIENITQKVNNDNELQDKINELIHYYLYHN